MDLLAQYGSDEDGEVDLQGQKTKLAVSLPLEPASLPAVLIGPIIPKIDVVAPSLSLPSIPSNPGRYISKRERQQMLSESSSLASSSSPSSSELSARSPLLYADYNPQKIVAYVSGHRQSASERSLYPSASSHCLQLPHDHSGPVNTIKWSPNNGKLLASASMDHSIRLWDVFDQHQCVSVIGSHTGAVRDIQFNHEGTCLLSGGFDKSIRYTDISTSKQLKCISSNEFVTCLKIHPQNENIFLAGFFMNGIKSYDLRLPNNEPVKEYKAHFGAVQDMEWLPGGDSFLACADVVKRNATDRAIMAWDYDKHVILSNQIYTEAYSCTSLRVHPFKSEFIAQSNGNYAAIFGTSSPWKMNKRKRFEGHTIGGYRIQCNISPDGKYVASGSADGNVHFYDYDTSKSFSIIAKAHEKACIEASFHPMVPGMVATCSWDGSISLYQ